jgi:hypothetical protein
MSGGRPSPRGSVEDLHWVDVFKDRVKEPLKGVLQEGMDWTTSSSILDLLNKLQSVEEARSSAGGPGADGSRVAEQSADTERSQ